MTTRRPKPVRALASLALAVLANLAMAQDLSMVFRDKPPYSYVEQGVQKGFLLDRTRLILEAAAIRHNFREMPPKRIFQEIQDNAEAICSFGWYKIPEREKFARFSLPIHTDRPHVVLAGPRSAEDVRRHKTLKSLMADGALTLATVDGVSYGPDLDAMIASFAGKNDRALVPPLQVAKKVAAKRADFMLIDQEDYDYLMATNPEFRDEMLVRIEYPDLPPGLKRYILCSQRVGAETMAKIDAAIERLAKRR
jgi:polar amino acid transport system substrate-binding protein